MNIESAQEQIARLKYLISLPSTDICWSSYNSVNDAIEELEKLEKGIAKQDEKSINKLLFLLLPTGELQEISISSGWADEFLVIAERLETALGKYDN